MAGFLASVAMKSEAVIDLSGTGSIGFTAVALAATSSNAPARVLLSCYAVGLWSGRLASFLAYRAAVDGDARLKNMLPPKGESWAQHPKRLLGLAGFFTAQVVWGLTLLSPNLLLLRFGSALSVPIWKGWLGLAVAGSGLLLQGIADQHKMTAKHNGVDLVTTGPYSIVQYPNYTGELMFWGGLGLYQFFSFGSSTALWMRMISFLPVAFDALLLLRASGIPLTQSSRSKRFANDEQYAEYTRRVPNWLIPGLY